MIDDPRVFPLLEELLDSGGLPEEVCRSCPELLPQVRRRPRRRSTTPAHANSYSVNGLPDGCAGAPGSDESNGML